MNTFWDWVDWLLPPVRIVDDLADPSEYSHRSRSSHHPSSTRRHSGRDHEKDRDRDRERSRRREKEQRGKEKEKNGRTHEQDKERELLRQRILQLERENTGLLDQLRTTREELSKLTAILFPTPSPSDSSPALLYPPTPIDPTMLPLPPSPSPSHLPLPISAQNSAEAALADPRRLRVLYNSLRATYGDARQTIRAQAEELSALKSFLSKTDEWSGAQLLQALADLNAEIVQLAASVAEEFAPAFRADTRAPAVAKDRDREIVRPALGREMMKLLEGREHESDPTLVQFAIQAWQVWCVARVMDAFCYGLPLEVDEALRLIFERMQREEPQPTTSRWRALTYKHARSLLARTRGPDLSTTSPSASVPSPFHSAPASVVSSSSLPPPLVSLTEANLRGVLAILALAGCTDPRGLHRDPLRARFGSALARISARAERISAGVREGVLSGLFEIVWVHPCQSPKPKPKPTPKSTPSQPVPEPAVNGSGVGRGKGKEREWLEEVERAQHENGGEGNDGDDGTDVVVGRADERWFDWASMENVYAGHCSERCRVLCTVELGLAFSRRLSEDEDGEGTVDGDGMPVARARGHEERPSAARPVAMGGVGLEGMVRNLSVSSAASGASGVSGDCEGMVARNLLLKPKVLLESVVDIL